MYEHIHTAKDREDGVLTISQQNQMQEKYLLMVLRLLVLIKGCYHKALDLFQADVCISDDRHPNCETACPSCNREHNNMFLQVNQQSVKRALVDIFIRKGESLIPPMQLCKRLQEIKTTICFYSIRKTRKTCWYITSKD